MNAVRIKPIATIQMVSGPTRSPGAAAVKSAAPHIQPDAPKTAAQSSAQAAAELDRHHATTPNINARKAAPRSEYPTRVMSKDTGTVETQTYETKQVGSR